PRLVPQELHAPRRRAALDLEHHPALERLEARVRQEERDADRGLAGGGEPLAGEEERRTKLEPLFRQLPVDLERPRLKLGAADAHAEIADAEVEEVVVRELLPGDLRSR